MDKNEIVCDEGKKYSNLEIRGPGCEFTEERWLLLELLQDFSINNNVFSSFFRGIIDAYNEESILCKEFTGNRKHIKKQGLLQVDVHKLQLTEELCENGSVEFYIFESLPHKVEMKDFISLKLNHKHTFNRIVLGKGILLFAMNLVDFEFPTITVKNTHLNQVLDKFSTSEYLIRRYKNAGIHE